MKAMTHSKAYCARIGRIASLNSTTALAVLTLCSLAAPAAAQARAAQDPADQSAASSDSTTGNSDGGIESIVVTARRISENLQSVPVAVSVVSGEKLRSQNVLRFEDLQRTTPGFTSAPAVRGNGTSTYSIRGQRGANTQTQLADPAVSVYLNEFNLSRSTGTNQTLFDLESVQVLKGPQGTLFGRNSTGGAVLITTKKPTTDALEGYVQASYGNYDYRDLEAVLNVPLGDKVAVRAGMKLSRRDGYLRNVITGQRVNDLDADAYRLGILLRPSESIESVFTGTYFRGGGAGTGNKLFVVYPAGVAAYPGGARPLVTAALQNELALTQGLGDYEYRGANLLDSHTTAWTIQNNTTFELGESFLGDLTLKNIMGYKRVKDHYPIDQFSLGIGISQYRTTPPTLARSREFTEELQLQGKAGNLEYLIGGYYFRETGRDRFDSASGDFLVTPAFLAQLPLASQTILRNAFPSVNHIDVDAKAVAYAAFAHATYRLDGLAEGLSISGGVRYNEDKRYAVYHNQAFAGVTPRTFRCTANGVVLTAIDRTACAVPREVSTSEVTYDVSLDYKVTPQTLLYVAHRHGFRSGGFNITPPPITNPPVPAFYEPEIVDDVEVGLKTDFTLGSVPGRLNLAGFYQWYSNVQRTTSLVLGPGQVVSTIVNAAKLEIPGGEAELTLKPLKNLELTGSVAIIRPKYKSYTDAYLVNGVATTVDISDSPLAYVPYDSWAISARYEFDLPPSSGELSVFANYSHQSSFSTQEPDSTNCGPNGLYRACSGGLGRLPAYGLLNARIEWRNMLGYGFDLSVFGNNLTNELYFTNASNAVGSLGFATRYIGTPRMYGLQLRVPFN